jgi:hypothetical protein
MKLCITHRERNSHWRKRVKFAHSAGDQLHRAGRLHPATACTKVPQVLPYPCSRRFPRRRSDHGPPAQVKRRRAFFGESSQPAQPSSRLQTLVFFFSTLIRTRPSRDRPKAADPSHPVQNLPPCLASSHPSSSSASAFVCLDRFHFDVNRIVTRLFLMNLSFLFF